jgi:D-arabinitol dehydrogenase (NADP+)
VPEPKAHEILVKGMYLLQTSVRESLDLISIATVKSCGVCGTDLHIHNGDFDSRMPVVTGHETSGIVVKMGTDVTDFRLGDKVTADNSELCGHCHYCREGKMLYCENFAAHRVHREFSRWLSAIG